MDLTGATWRKSTRSGNNGGDCVEVTAVQDARKA
jgi:membrane protein implicated in regulation of membrane protease activity